MKNMLQIAVVDLRLFLSDRGSLLSLILLPVLMSVLLGGAFNSGDLQAIRVDIIDQDGSALSQQFVEELRAVNNTLVLCPMDDAEEGVNCRLNEVEGLDDPNALTEEQGIERVQASTTAALIVIPEGYEDSVLAFEEVALTYYSLADITTGDAVLQSVQAVLQRANGAVVAARVSTGAADALPVDLFADEAAREAFAAAAYDNASAAWENVPVRVRYVTTQEGEQDDAPQVSGFSQSVPGMGTMFVLFTVLGGLGVMLQERKQWTLQRLVVMPISRADILGGKILARFTTGMIQFGVLFVVGVFVGLDFGNDPVALLVIAMAYTLTITALTFAIAPMIRTQSQAGSLTNLLAVTLAALGGAWWPLEIVPEFMRTIGHLSPVAWAMNGFNQLLFYGGGLADVLGYVAVLLAAAAVLFVIGIARFQYE